MNNTKKRLSSLSVIVILVLSLITAFASLAFDEIDINSVFPDPVLRDAIALHYDSDKNGRLSAEERDTDTMIVSALIDELALSRGVDSDTLTVSDITGIEHFDGLRVLRCNNIGELGTIDVSSLTELETLDCSDDSLESLDISANQKLTRLHCCSNDFISLDFSANRSLEWIHCYANLELEELIVDGLTSLEELRCDGCQLTSLDLSTNTSLSVLNCSYNHLSKLDLDSTKVNGLSDYHIGNQTISAELVYDNGLIKAPVELEESLVTSTSLDAESKAYSDGAFFTDDYDSIKNGFTYLYKTNGTLCADMKVSVSVSHSHSYVVTGSDFDNKNLTVKCQICGEEHVLDADYDETYAAPDCTESGSITKTLSAVFEGETYTKQDVTDIPPNGHTEVTDEAVSPTCTETGLTEGKHCSVCNAVLVEQNVVPANGHTEVTDEAVLPTCTETGLTEGKHCSVCNAVLVEQTVVPANGHTEVTDDAVSPTCTETGLTEGKHCSVCNAVLVEQTVVPANGHTEVTDEAVSPTCTETGLTEGKHCSVCNAVIVEQTVVPANGHTEVTDEAVSPTCTETGLTEGKHCSVCNTVLIPQERVEPLNHSYVAVVTAPTCTEQGYTTHTCSRCDDSYTDSYTQPSGHKWDGGVITVQPTEEKEGVRTYTCSVCQAVKTESVPRLEPSEEIAPTDEEADKAVVNRTIQRPAGIVTVSNKKRKELKVSFKAVSGAVNYRVMFRKQGVENWTYSWTKGKTEYVIKNLKNNGLYEFKFAAYKKNSKGQWERGEYSKTSYRYYYKAALKKVKAAKNSLSVSWKRNKNATSYLIEYADNYKMKRSKRIRISSNKITSYKIKKLKKGKKYYVRVRAEKKKAGKNYIGEFSKRKGVKIK